jgi:hypothetical protein
LAQCIFSLLIFALCFFRFNLGGGFPNFAIYTPSKKVLLFVILLVLLCLTFAAQRVVPYRGGFNLEDIDQWIDHVLVGGVSTSTLVENLTFA